jgi:hypothetical protein
MRVREREGLPKINMAVNFEERRGLIDSKKLKPKTTSFNIYINSGVSAGFTRVNRVLPG